MSQPQTSNNNQRSQQIIHEKFINHDKKYQQEQLSSPTIDNDQQIMTLQVNTFQWKGMDQRTVNCQYNQNKQQQIKNQVGQQKSVVFKYQRRYYQSSDREQESKLIQNNIGDSLNQQTQHLQRQFTYNTINNQPQQEQQTNQQTLPQPNQRITQRLYSLTQSLRKIYYRNFFNRLITFFIQSLKYQQKKIRQTKEIEIKQLKQLNWPFKQLYYKKYRTPNQQIMFEFVNLCASKIQATFKAYIMHKRHKLAIAKINKFKQKLCAVLKGWKTSNIYNCKNIKQIRKNFMLTSLQIDQQISNPNIDKVKKIRKIQYLQMSKQTFKDNFLKSVQYLYDSGAWIFQVQKCMKIVERKNQYNRNQVIHDKFVRTNNSIQQDKNYVHYQQQNIQQLKSQKPQKRTRQRQFRAETKNSTKPTKQSLGVAINGQKIPNKLQASIIKQSSQTTTFSSINYQTTSASQERPIVAKGKYQFTQEDLQNNQNQFIKPNYINKNKNKKQQQDKNNTIQNDKSIVINNDDDNNDTNNQQPKINKFRDQQKKKLVKRQKYDPRKAIQEEKKRIQQQKRIKLQKQKQIKQNGQQPQQKFKQQVINNNKIKKQTKNNKKQPQPSTAATNKRTPRIQQQKKQPQQNIQNTKQQQSSKQKTVQKIKKQSKLNKKGDNNKSIKSIVVNHKKVQSKVDCWGPKRESIAYGQRVSIGGDDINNTSSYKSKYLTGLIKQRTQQSKSYHEHTSSSKTPLNKYQNQQKSKYQQQYQQQQQQQYYQQAINNRKPTYSYQHNRQNNLNQKNQQFQQQQQQYNQQQETYQSSYLRKLVKQRQSGKFSYANNRLAQIIGNNKINQTINSNNKFIVKKQQQQEPLQQKFDNLTNHIKQRLQSSQNHHHHNNNHNNSSTNIQKNIQLSQQQKHTTNESHRPIQSLQQVYSSQYTDRLNNLKTKLNMLQSARYIQRDQSVPVLLEDSKYVKKMYKQGVFSTLYWPQVRTMETAFLDYVKLTGF